VSLAAVLLLTSLDHPFKELSRGGLWPVEWGLLALQAALVAPIMEEVCFRGLLLRWLKRASFPGLIMVAAFTLLNGSMPLLAALTKEQGPVPPLDALLGPLIWATAMVGVYIVLLVQTWRELRPRWEKIQASLPPRELPADTDPDPGPPPLPPWFLFSIPSEPPPRSQVRLMLWGQAMLFTAFHSPVWPTPIPLLVLALGLGWLALRTNSLLAPIVVHILFNSVASVYLLASDEWLLIGPVQPAPPAPPPP
jgi:membrane protease YdiL (CAAX protease family)